jgi:LysM repeat protein
LFTWLVVTLACNSPKLEPPPQDLSVEDLRRTLAAQSSPTIPAAQTLQPPVVASPEPLEPTSASTPASAPAPTDAQTPAPHETLPPTPGLADSSGPFLRYLAQPGDTLPALAARFEVEATQINSPRAIPPQAFIPAGQELYIPNAQVPAPYPLAVLPDGEVVNSPTAVDFDLAAYIQQGGGYLSAYEEQVGGQPLSGAQIVARVARESSVNPRLLLALLELRSGWVFGQPPDARRLKYPLGFSVSGWEGLYKELVIAATHLNAGYYGWRNGTAVEMQFPTGAKVRLSPPLNAGSAAVQYLLARLYQKPQDWEPAIYGSQGLLERYQQMFGDPWARAASAGPLFPEGVSQPSLELPFVPGLRWSLTGGPHLSWKTGSPRGALDLAPVTGEARCANSAAWVTAPAAGLVTRSERNTVTLDLDGDGNEQTGWVILFLHLADFERVAAGTRVQLDERLGHPSCEGGASTGTHVHIARKFNGEWISADGPLPFVLGGWQAYAGEKDYQGGLRKGDQEVVASPVGPRTSIITR